MIYEPPSQNAIQKTLDAQLLSGITASMTLNNVTGIQNKPGVCVVDLIDANGNFTPSKREYISFTGVSGSTLTGLTRNADGGGSDQDHAVGAIVQFPADVIQQQAIIDTFEVEHNLTDGKHTSALVTTLKATGAVVNTGTSDVTIVTPKALADSDYAKTSDINVTPDSTTTFSNKDLTSTTNTFPTYCQNKVVSIQVVAGGDSLTVADGQAYITIPLECNGMNLVGVHARVVTAGTTNTTDIQIRNVTDSVDMLSTKITIDSGETGSDTAATPAVIDTTHDDVATNDLLAIDVDAINTTAPKGLIVVLRFARP